jgi:hypothetical protein
MAAASSEDEIVDGGAVEWIVIDSVAVAGLRRKQST